MEAYDVIVVGGGPAGATAAYFLGEAGKRVLVLEKERLPRYKTCGGGLSRRMLEQFPFSFEPVLETRVYAITYALGERQVTFPFTDPRMCMVMRDRFDAHILAHARADVHTGEAAVAVEERIGAVWVRTKSGAEYQAGYLVAADGANSIAAHSLGLRRRRDMAAALEVEAVVPEEVFQRFQNAPVFIFGEVSYGYLWIFPKHDHLSVGIAALHPKPGQIQAILKRVMDRYGIPLDRQATHGHPIPLFLRWEKVATRRVALVGDAAGLVDPLSGEGIRFAVKTGRMAAEAILSGDLNRYRRAVAWQISLNHTFAWILCLLFYKATRLCFLFGVRNPFATRAFMDMLAGEIGYPVLLLELFGSLPLFIFSELVGRVGRLAGRKKFQRRVRHALRAVL